MSIDFEKLLAKSKNSLLTQEELDSVVHRIQKLNDSNLKELDTLLYILGISPNGVKYRHIVENYLMFPKEPMISCLALKIVCNYWGLTENYIDVLTLFLKGVEWDNLGDVRLVAITAAGEYLCENKNKELMQQIFKIYENEQESILMRSVAYTAMERSIGIEWSEIPSTIYLIEHLNDYSSSIVIDKIKHILMS